ncbi:MAG: hypothetical protein IK099_14320 [Clostridia bacterium]|nr:hypothetical protein [Clostridia bacterium]
MRGLRFFLLIVLCAAFLCFASEAGAEGSWYLRVIARNDSIEAQEEKLRVRDAVTAACPADAAALPFSLHDIEKAAESIAPCRVEIRSWTPDEALPAALTLYITVGEGRGHNCWGVLYADSLRMAQAEEIPGEPERVEFVWPIWSWILHLFGL